MTESNEWLHLEPWLKTIHVAMDAVEFHGMIAGLTIIGGTQGQEHWHELAGGAYDSNDLQHQEAWDGIQQLLKQLSEALDDPLLSFQPLDQGYDHSVAAQVEAMGLWCQGFILGISHQGLPPEEELSAESGEFLHDLTTISRADSFELAEDDSDLEALLEIGAYIKTGVLLLQEELRPMRHPKVPPHPLH